MTQPLAKLPAFRELGEVLTNSYGCTVERYQETFDGNLLDLISIIRNSDIRNSDKQTPYCAIDNIRDDDLVAPSVVRYICKELSIDLDDMWPRLI